jgi:hypothetical protein
MSNQPQGRWIISILAIGGAVFLVGVGYLVLAFWLKPATQNELARAQSTPTSPMSQPLEPDSTTSAVSSNPTFPIRGAFYYTWYPQAWTQKNKNPYSNYQPSLGYYDSTKPDVVKEHISEMQYANIQVGIAAWFGQGTESDKAVPLLLQQAAGTGFDWSIYYEMPSIKDTSVTGLHADLAYIRDHYAADPSYLKINGRFVVFVFNPASGGCDTVSKWMQANQDIHAYLVLKVVTEFKTCPSQPDGWHQYSPTNEISPQGKFSFTISPGFWQLGESPRLPRDLTRWANDVQQMVASGAQFQLITSFNEWGEGTAIEAGAAWETASDYGAYLDVLHNATSGQTAQVEITPLVPQTGAAQPTPQTTVSPQATPLPPSSASPPAAEPAGSDPILLAAGDISSCTSKGDVATAKILSEYPTAAIATLGDTVYEEGTATQFAQCFDPAWGPYKDRIHPALGNHDYLTANASGYFGYFGAAAGDPTKGYYSYDLGAWHVIVLNSNCSKVSGCGLGSPQEQWLKADLAAHPVKCTLAYWHHPRWSDGEHGNQDQVAALWTDLYNAGADLVLSGHDHDYERFEPLDANGNPDPLKGMREFVVGTGGKNYYPFNTAIASISQTHVADVFGVLKLVLHPTGYDWQFIPEAGKEFTDTGSGVCH